MIETTVDGRYQVIARVASGGMGEVYRAHDAVLDREVALKVLHSNLASDDGFIDRFRREARAAAMLNHPNIVAVHDWGATDGTYFMVMEFIRGHSLRQILSRQGRLAPGQAAEVVLQVLAALDHAHTRGIVHRDIKPENILVTPDGVTKVADFGLARALAESTTTHAPGTVTGTVQYLAPEQVQGEPSDPRTDLYAVGIVLFELLTGHVPFTGETSLAIAYKHLSSRVPAPSKLVAGITPAIDRIVLQATEKDREKRPPSASRMRKDLVRAATSLPPARPVGEVVGDMPASDIVPEDRAPTVTIPRTLSKRTKRRRALRRALWRVAIVAVVILGMWATWTFAVPHRVEVPRLVGLGVPAAARAAEDAGLQVEVTREVHSSSVPDGQIISQDPAAGARIERGSTISLVRSLGPDLRQVPPVEGRDRETAVRLLREAGFVVKVERAFDETAAPGTVIDQDPGAGSSYERGRTVTITVSRGRPFVDVPSVVGETRESAVALLSSANLEFTEREAFSGAVEQGRVISQSPDGGTNVREGETVTIVVSKGPRVFPMPNVVGKSEAQARSQLEDMGLEVRTVQVPGSLGGSVVSQVPEPGTQVEQGDRVTIYVA